MAQNVTVAGASYSGVPSVELPKTGGGTAVFYDASIATATAAEILSGYTAFGATGLLTGTASGGGGATRTPRVPQQSVTTNSSRQAILQNGTGSIADDDYYVVTYDGMEYLCTSNVLWTDNYVIGDVAWATGTTNDYIYPFAIVYYNGTYYFFSTTASATHTVKVEHIDISGGGGSGGIPKICAIAAHTFTGTAAGSVLTTGSIKHNDCDARMFTVDTSRGRFITKSAGDYRIYYFGRGGYNSSGSAIRMAYQITKISGGSTIQLVSGNDVTNGGICNYVDVTLAVDDAIEASSYNYTNSSNTHDFCVAIILQNGGSGGDPYEGSYTVTPTKATQTLQTNGLTMTDDVTINPIPNEYIIPTGSQTVTQNGTVDVTSLAQLIVNVAGGGGSGLEYETGTWEPTSDIARGEITWSKTHTEAPALVFLCDVTGTAHSTTNSTYFFAYADPYKLWGKGYPYTQTGFRYAIAWWSYRSTASSVSTNGYLISNNSDSTSSSGTSYPRYWASPTGFYPYGNATNRYWRAGRTYKWIAVWKPST